MNNRIKGNLMLLLTAAIWGFAFVAQSMAMEDMGPLTFQGIRFIIGGVVLLPVIFIINRKKADDYDSKTLVVSGLLCGIILCAAGCCQQLAIAWGAPTGKAGFITAMYILIVPLIGLMFKKKTTLKVWIAVVIAVLGLYFLSIKDGFAISKSDLMLICCALLYAVQIMLVDRVVDKVDGVKLSFVEFVVAGVISMMAAFIFESPSVGQVGKAWFPIVFTGVFSCGLGYTLQILGQKYTDPVVASLLMSLESVFALIGGLLFLKQIPTGREWLGIGLMFVAIMLSQIPDRKNSLQKI